jgi:hypothetical protein
VRNTGSPKIRIGLTLMAHHPSVWTLTGAGHRER